MRTSITFINASVLWPVITKNFTDFMQWCLGIKVCITLNLLQCKCVPKQLINTQDIITGLYYSKKSLIGNISLLKMGFTTTIYFRLSAGIRCIRLRVVMATNIYMQIVTAACSSASSLYVVRVLQRNFLYVVGVLPVCSGGFIKPVCSRGFTEELLHKKHYSTTIEFGPP